MFVVAFQHKSNFVLTEAFQFSPRNSFSIAKCLESIDCRDMALSRL